MEKIMKLFRATLMPLSIAALLIFPLNIVHAPPPIVTATISVAPGSGPWGVAFNPSNNLLYVTDLRSNTVSAICEGSTCGTIDSIVATIPMLGSGAGIALGDCPTSANAVGGATYTQVAPTGIAYDSNNNNMYVASTCGLGFGEGAWDGGVSVISPSNVVTTIVSPGFNTVWGNRFTVGTTPFSVAFDNPTRHMVYIANDGGSIWGIKDLANTVVTEFNFGQVCPSGNQCLLNGIAYDPATSGTYAQGICATSRSGTGHLFCIPAQTTSGHSISLACPPGLCTEFQDMGISAMTQPVGIVITASAANNIYVSELGPPQLCQWDSDGHVGSPPCSGLAASAEGIAYGHINSLGDSLNRVYVASPVGDKVFVCNPSSLNCPGGQSPVSLPVGSEPIGITVVPSVVPAQNCFFVANANSNTVSKVC